MKKEENSGAAGLALSRPAGKSGLKPRALRGRPEWSAHCCGLRKQKSMRTRPAGELSPRGLEGKEIPSLCSWQAEVGCALLWTEEKEEQENWAGREIEPKEFGGKRNPFSMFMSFL
jgi:hypothetical protein